MRFDRNLVVLGATLVGLTSVLVAGCDKRQEGPSTTAVKTTPGMEIDDTVVTTKVKSALLADADIKSFDLKVETRKGTVQLSGFVDNQTQVDRAIATTRAVEGVHYVDNNITLKDGPATVGNAVDDDIITTKVKSALLGDPDIKSFDIAVVTRKGEVQLSGFVNSLTQIDRAIAIVKKVDGVSGVHNEMSVKR